MTQSGCVSCLITTFGLVAAGWYRKQSSPINVVCVKCVALHSKSSLSLFLHLLRSPDCPDGQNDNSDRCRAQGNYGGLTPQLGRPRLVGGTIGTQLISIQAVTNDDARTKDHQMSRNKSPKGRSAAHCKGVRGGFTGQR